MRKRTNSGILRAARRRRTNPLVRYHAEKGPARKRSSGWKTLEGAPASNTFWEAGDLDFGGKLPRVFVGPREVTPAAWKGAGSRVTTYLLHPDKWSGGVPSALGMIPNVSQGPGKPVAYALRVRYEVPVKLHSDPSKPANPRAWFEARGRATAGRVVGHTVITRTQRREPIYDEIVVHAPVARRGVTLINGRRKRRNPYVRYHAEKGPPVLKSGAWKTLEGNGVSNTYWSEGSLDYGGAVPKVFVGPRELTASAFAASTGGKVTSYLLHPNKWGQEVPSALGMLPNIAKGPDKPLAYARRVVYDVPVKLHSEPGRDKNPRAWFEARGRAVGGKVIGHTVIKGSGKRVPIYDEIRVSASGGRGVVLANGRRRRRRIR